jgi:hypothetical protein
VKLLLFSLRGVLTASLWLGSALSHTIDWGEKADFSPPYY